ncbi:MAG: hypothetical protein COU65_03110 [Candidatus Pacebacteria bacterium CG10_big_fil_rev_8_21_14_0_10_42_12]|nr:hypothetical protein [Candidatus Paceibacterota bacterium]PIR62534.1 MAG: hypothetical protein COU65_03110 [Candidatus Pacebacteria bacterium CG10_big_fil_rev_8_21_14_0_10_42_12]
MSIEGKDFTKLSREQIRDWLQSHRDVAGQDSKPSPEIAKLWDEVASYYSANYEAEEADRAQR